MKFMISSSRSALAGEARLERDERLDDLHVHRVGLGDRGRLGHRRVLEQRRLDLERPDEVAAGVDDVVVAADEPEVAVRVDAARGRRRGTSRS